MAKRIYEEEAKYLADAIDIAIHVFENYPLPSWNKAQIDHVKNFYLESKNSALNPEPKYKNIASLKYIKDDIFTPFQEGSGKYVDVFWMKIKESNLPFERENKLEKILKRKRINNEQEYNYVIDTIVPFQQEGRISEEDVINLNTYIDNFEKKNKLK